MLQGKNGFLNKAAILSILLLTVSIIPIGASADQPGNDAFGTAEEINEGTHTGSLSQTDEVDYYKITLNSSTIISITFSSDALDDMSLAFYNPSQEEVFILYSSEGTKETDSYYLANETTSAYWYVKIDRYYSESGGYTFSVDLDKQNDAESGVDVSEDHPEAYEIEPKTEINGYLGDLDEADMYKVMLSPSSIVTLSFSSRAEDDQELTFLNPNREDIFTMYSSSEEERIDDYYLANETVLDYWFIKVDRYYSDGNYSFTVSVDMQNDAGSGVDVSEDYPQAYEIEPGRTVNGFLGDLDEFDMYKIEIMPGSIVTVSFKSEAEDDQELTFQNPNKEDIFTFYSSQEVTETDDYYLANETAQDYWFIKVDRYYSDGNYSFNVSIDMQNDAGSGGDVSGGYSEAYEISTDTEISGFVGDLDEVDVYKLEIQPGSMVEISFTSYTEDDQFLEFMNPNKEELFTLYSSSEAVEIDNYYLANETETDHWFIKANRYNSDSGNYSFTVASEMQDDAGSQNDVSSGYDDAYEIEGNRAYEGILGYLDDTDVYMIYLHRGSEITLNFTAESQPGLDLYFLNPDRVEELSFRSSGGATQRRIFDVGEEFEPDYWYIKIEMSSGGSSGYTLETSVETTGGISPVSVWTTSYTDTSVDIQWTGYTGADFEKYEIYISNQQGLLGDLKDEIFDQGDWDHTLMDLTPETTYYITVRVYNESGDYADSDQVFVSTDASHGGGPIPAMVTIKDRTENSIVIEWTMCQESEFDRYEIYMSDSQDVSGSMIESIGSRGTTSYQITGLDPGTTYFFSVNVVHRDGSSAMSNSVSAITEEEDTVDNGGDSQPWTICCLIVAIGVIMIVLLLVIVAVAVAVKKGSGSKKGPDIEE